MFAQVNAKEILFEFDSINRVLIGRRSFEFGRGLKVNMFGYCLVVYSTVLTVPTVCVIQHRICIINLYLITDQGKHEH